MRRRVCSPARYRSKPKHALPKWLMKVERVKSTTSSAKHDQNAPKFIESEIPRSTITAGNGLVKKQRPLDIPLTTLPEEQTVVFPKGHGQGLGPKALTDPPKHVPPNQHLSKSEPLPEVTITPYVSYGAVSCKN